MSIILALDPGTEQTGFVLYTSEEHRVMQCGLWDNHRLRRFISRDDRAEHLAIEMIASYGMAVGAEVFETCVWIGRFMEQWPAGPEKARLIFRKDVKLFLCGAPNAKDPNVRQAILDRFERSGAGATPQVGTSKKPGPLFGMNSHMWPALGVALVRADQLKKEKRK